MSEYDECVERRALEVNRILAEEFGGCFYYGPQDEQGECADGECFCTRVCGEIARATMGDGK